jgi:hypothetical protein
MKRSESICCFESLEGRELLSTVSAGLSLSVSNAPIWAAGKAWSCNYSLFNWTGPNVLVNNIGLTAPHADLSINAYASTGTVSANVGGSISVILPDTAKAGQTVPITIKFTPTSETMSGLLGAGVSMPLNLSLGYKNIPALGTGTISKSLDMVSVWDQYVKTPNIPQNFNLNTPLTSYTPAFGKTVTDNGSQTVISGLQVDALKLAGYFLPAAATVDSVLALNLGTNVSVTRADHLTFSEFDGNVTINGTKYSFAIPSSGSTTFNVCIPSTAKSSLSVSVGSFSMKNSFYTSFGVTASPYVEVDGKIPLVGQMSLYHLNLPNINVPFGSTATSQLNLSTGVTESGTIKIV